MPPKKRNSENKGLPARWTFKNGAYFYLVPRHLREQWDGKSWFRLGSSLSEAYKAWADRIGTPDKIHSIGALLDRYLAEVVPTKAPKTATENRRHIATLRPVFGHMRLEDIEPMHAYQYADKRSAKVAARHEIEVLRHALTKAVQWGLIKTNPLLGQLRMEKPKARTRYVEDWELLAALKLPSHKRKGSVGMVQAYITIKVMTGARQRDLLTLTMADLKADGIHITPSKTRHTTGKRQVYTWTPELRDAVDLAIAIRPALSPYLFCKRTGAGFVTEDGRANDWNNLWQRFIRRVLNETEVTERFTEHDLRAKVASDAHDTERARKLLAHADTKTTERIYRRRAEQVEPARPTCLIEHLAKQSKQ